MALHNSCGLNQKNNKKKQPYNIPETVHLSKYSITIHVTIEVTHEICLWRTIQLFREPERLLRLDHYDVPEVTPTLPKPPNEQH